MAKWIFATCSPYDDGEINISTVNGTAEDIRSKARRWLKDCGCDADSISMDASSTYISASGMSGYYKDNFHTVSAKLDSDTPSAAAPSTGYAPRQSLKHRRSGTPGTLR